MVLLVEYSFKFWGFPTIFELYVARLFNLHLQLLLPSLDLSQAHANTTILLSFLTDIGSRFLNINLF